MKTAKSRRFRTRFAAACCVVAFVAVAFCQKGAEPTRRDGVRERSTVRLTRCSDFVFVAPIPTDQRAKSAPLAKRVRADFSERLRERASEFLAARKVPEVGVDGATLRTVASGLARWNVGAAAARDVFAELSERDRNAANDVFSRSEPYDFATERAASNASARRASSVLDAMKNDSDESPQSADLSGVDAALEFLRAFDGDDSGPSNAPEPFAAALDWTSGNPIDSVGIFAETDFVAVRSSASVVAENAFEAFGALFFFWAFGPVGVGWIPGAPAESVGGAAAVRRKIAEFFEQLSAARRSANRFFGAAFSIFLRLLYSLRRAILRKKSAFGRRFRVGFDAARLGTAAEFALASTGTRLRN